MPAFTTSSPRSGRLAASYLSTRVRPVAPASRTAYCTPIGDRRKSVPAVQLPRAEKLARLLDPKRTGSGDGGSPPGPRMAGSTAICTPGNIDCSQCGPCEHASGPTAISAATDTVAVAIRADSKRPAAAPLIEDETDRSRLRHGLEPREPKPRAITLAAWLARPASIVAPSSAR